jgi:hypothetical protein
MRVAQRHSRRHSALLHRPQRNASSRPWQGGTRGGRRYWGQGRHPSCRPTPIRSRCRSTAAAVCHDFKQVEIGTRTHLLLETEILRVGLVLVLGPPNDRIQGKRILPILVVCEKLTRALEAASSEGLTSRRSKRRTWWQDSSRNPNAIPEEKNTVRFRRVWS